MQSHRTPQKFPVFVFPSNITFYLDDQATHKQVLTLYNPYDFTIKFKVFSTAPNKYKVVDSEGIITAKSCVDIVIRHVALVVANCYTVDRFRIQMQEHPTKQIIGRRDVEARLVPGSKDTRSKTTPDPDSFEPLPKKQSNEQSTNVPSRQSTKATDGGTNYVALIGAIICILGLLMPTQGDGSELIPPYFHPSINLKLTLSFVLGMVTIVILRL